MPCSLSLSVTLIPLSLEHTTGQSLVGRQAMHKLWPVNKYSASVHLSFMTKHPPPSLESSYFP